MNNELLAPLKEINVATRTLLADTDLSFENEQIVQSIGEVSQQMIELVASMPDPSWEKARDVLSFESRSHLASIIGYAEVLLSDEFEPEDAVDEQDQLTSDQATLVHKIRQNGKMVLTRLIRLEQ